MSLELQAHVGLRIVEARKAAGLSQRELGLAVGSATRTVQSWETSQRIPRTGTLERIAQVTGRSAAWFYTYDEGLAA